VSIFPERLRCLSVAGCVSSVVYVFIAAIFWTDAIFIKSRWVSGSTCIVIALLTGLYFLGIPLVRTTPVRTIVIFAVIFAILGFVAGPFDSTDVFFYIAHGWAQAHYSGNPYAHRLRDIPNSIQDPMIASRWMSLNVNPWLDEPMPYGFVFAHLTYGLAWLGGGNWWFTFALFNLLNLAIHAAVSFLLWKTAGLIPGAEPKLILYLYTWSPLIVLQFLVNVHNDIIMASLIVLAFFLLMTERVVWVLPILVTAGLVKYAAFALVPLAVAFVVRRYGWKAASKSLLLAAALGAAISFPYVSQIESFRFHQIAVQVSDSTGSLHAFVTHGYRAMTRLMESEPLEIKTFDWFSGILLWMSVAAFALRQFLEASLGLKMSAAETAKRWTSILFAIVFVGSPQFYAWYIGILLPLSLLGAGRSRLTDVVVVLSGTHMVFGFLRNKAIGYFLFATAIPVLLVMVRRSKDAGRNPPILASSLSRPSTQ